MIARIQLAQFPTPVGPVSCWDADLWTGSGEPADPAEIDAARLKAHCAPALTWLASLHDAGLGGGLMVLPIHPDEIAQN